MALALIGESILAAVLEVLMERIVSPAIRDFFKSQKIDDEELKKLKARMRKGVREVQIELTKILKNLEELVDQKDVLGLIERIGGEPSLSRTPTTSLVDEHDVYGRAAEKEAIMKLLLSDDTKGRNLDVILIVGMGGVGKTTLAQLLYKEMVVSNDRSLKSSFDLKAWVYVSEELDVLACNKKYSEGGWFDELLEGDDSGKTTERTRHLSYRATKDDSDQTFMAIKNPRLLRTLLCPSGWPSQVKQVEIICDLLPALKCLRLVELPANMGSLINLRHLDIQHTKLPEMPLQMGKLTKLRKLTDFFIGKQSGSSIKELGKVHHLSGALSVWNLQNVTDARDAFEANLKGKEHLEKLELIWDCDMDNSLVHERVLEQLQPPSFTSEAAPDLKKALFTHFPSLTKLDIGACEQFEIEFFPLELFPKLESLTIGSCPSLVSFSKGAPVAPNLKELKVTELFEFEGVCPPNLKDLLFGVATNSLQAAHNGICNHSMFFQDFQLQRVMFWSASLRRRYFPSSLTHLEIRTQKNLKSLNYKGLKHLTSLRELTIMNCMEVSMPEEGLPPSISSVTIWQCPLLEKECEMGMRKVPKYLRCPEHMIPGRKSV
ncbi:hypothetical protein OIU79_009662 [Salix purpurea]|uniref:Uncharacterized protein n=1 Tax=Salix purpurea TaxID=77065 RepID=A0A9Q0T818_SALPP|nr:hypothetical protein OIU79_009662 [Salix purpurea]